jgi:hypothetical protein
MNIRALLLLAFSTTLFAQTDTGTIAGSVTDRSGAVIVRALITAVNQATGLGFTGKSNDSGAYTIGALPAGRYDLTASVADHESESRTGITLNVQSRLQVNFVLQLGQVESVIEVSASATDSILDTQTTSIGQLIQNKLIVALPLNGRNYSQLALLATGAIPNLGSRAADGFSLNGSRTFENIFLLDGIDNNNYILGVDTNSTQALRPSIDAIQEFNIESAGSSAQFGRAAGGVISVSIKSGTNSLHGSAFEFLRNDKLDANNFFANRAGLKRPPLRRNQFGGTAGGPIVRNRTFVFASYQGTLVSDPATATTTVPSAAMVRGNFGTTPVFDPLSVVNGVRQPFPNNTIPALRLDPVGVRLAALYPAPNLPGSANNYVANIAGTDNEHEGDLRVDHRVNDKDSMFFRLSKYSREIVHGGFFDAPGNGGNGYNDFPTTALPQAYSVVFNETHFFSQNLVNEFRGGYTRNQSNQVTLAATPLFDQFGFRGISPAPGLNGLPSIAVTGFSQLGDRTFTPNPKLTQVRQAVDNASWSYGRHFVQFGLDMRFSQNYAASGLSQRSALTFNGQFTAPSSGAGGSALADLLLGQTSNAVLNTQIHGDLRDRYYGYFINDTWRVNSRLTLTLGLRYELQSPPWEHHNNEASFDLNPGDPAYGTLVQASGSSIRSRTFSNRDTNNFAPRLGFAYLLGANTVIRSSAGIYYGDWGYGVLVNLAPGNLPYFVSIPFPSSNTAATSSLVLANGFPQGTLDPHNARNPNAVAILPNMPVPQVAQWNFDIERKVSKDTLISVAYIGSNSSFLPGYVDINQPSPGPGSLNSRRRFPNFGSIVVNSGFAHSSYESLQAKLERRFSNGFSVLSSYTWSHTLDNSVNAEDTGNGDTLPQNPYDTNAERASSAIDMRHRSVTSFLYEPPLSGLNNSRLFRAVCSGWQLGAIVVASSGTPLTPTVSPNPANTSGPGRPNRLADGNLPGSQRTIDRWFDVSAFAPAAPFQYGDSGRGVITAPGLANVDGLLARNFTLGESSRIELRGEFFNLTNTAHFAHPGLIAGTPQMGRISATASPNRQLQLGLRLVF